MAVEQGRGAVGRGADLHEGVGIFRLVVEHAVVGDDLRRQQRLEFLARVGPVGAELVEQFDVVDSPAAMLEQPRDCLLYPSDAADQSVRV